MVSGLRKALRGAWREYRAPDALELPGGTYKLAWGCRQSKPRADYAMLFRLAQARTCVFDVGAKVGITALCMAGATPSGSVVAFEAAESSCFMIERNVGINQLQDRVVTVNAVVGAVSGSACVYYWRRLSGRSGVVLAPPGGAIPVRKVAVALDDYAHHNGHWPDLVKIDVEGAEKQVIAGMRGILQTVRPDVVLELHAWPGQSAAANAARILELLESVDYRALWLGTGQFLDDAQALADIATPPLLVEAQARLLLVPEGRPVPDWLMSIAPFSH